MTTAETIYELVKTMPEEQASLVLKLAETLQKRQMEKPLELEKSGVAESRYELSTESFEGSLRISQNHSAIQRRQKSLLDFFGILKDSPSFNGDPVEIQRRMRSDWD